MNKAAQKLTRLTLESSAQAALITRGKSLWAYAGGLSQETANELVQIVSRTSDEQKGGDLLRFARLETTRAEHMLYATTLTEGVILALVFDAETPFSTIRSQANLLARSLEVEKTAPSNPRSEPPAAEKVEKPVPAPKPVKGKPFRRSRPPHPSRRKVGCGLPAYRRSSANTRAHSRHVQSRSDHPPPYHNLS